MNLHLPIRILLLAAGALWLHGAGAARRPAGPEADSVRRPGAECHNGGGRDDYNSGYSGNYSGGGRDEYRSGDRNEYSNRYSNRYSGGQAAAQRPTAGSRLVHSIGAEFRPEYIFPTNPFLAGDNLAQRSIDRSLSGHLRYAFRYREGSIAERIYGDPYQGVGIACYDFGNRTEVGTPVAVYLFQGARLTRLASRLSLDYEWNLGLSFGWRPYDETSNPKNGMSGSRINALVNVNLLLDWQVHRNVRLAAGAVLTHFSNGNTQFPNAGLNSVGLRAGVTCDLNPRKDAPAEPDAGQAFTRHVSYDLTIFGAWRRRGAEIDGLQYAVPETFPVVGISFAPMYNFGYRFRAGAALDAVYDSSANVSLADQIVAVGEKPEIVVEKPGFARQAALGLSARAEFVMPHFAVGVGIGGNILQKGGEMDAWYQMLTLKIAITRSAYLHIGYSLRDFHLPNFLMLGVGYRFNNKYPRLR